MAEKREPVQHQIIQRPADAMKSMVPEKGPSASQILAVVTLFPVGGVLLFLSGLTLAGTLIGLALTTPLFVIFSPIIVPAVFAIGLAVTGFMTSGAFGITALSSLSWIMNYIRSMRSVPEQMEHMKQRAQDATGYVGQKTKEMGQRTQEAAKS